MTDKTDQIIDDWIDRQIQQKQKWLERFSAGRNKWPDHEIEMKKRDIKILRAIRGRLANAKKTDTADA